METRELGTQSAWRGAETGSDGTWALDASDPNPRGEAPAVARGVHAPELFGTLTPARRGRRQAWLWIQASLIAHAVIVAALVLVPILAPEAALPPLHTVVGTVYFDPPPPPPPPVASRPVRAVSKPEAPVPPDALPEVPVLPEALPEVLEIPDDLLDLPPDTSGVPEGMEWGIEGGVPGGVLAGVVGGVIGGTGTGPVPEPEPDRQPQPVRLSKPRYPPDAFVKRIEGTVELEILIDSLGRVVEARILKSIPLLDAAAVETVLEWRFAPAVKDGRRVAALARAPVVFRIH